MTYLQNFILAIIEGFTEFLPVSSTGHMVIASSFMGIADQPFTKLYTVAIQLGAIASVVVLYFKRFFKSISFYWKLLVGFIPAVFFGLLLNDFIDELLESPVTVAISLLVGGIVLIRIDRLFKQNQDKETPTYRNALIIGLFQCIAMIPGVSRSAATIVGGLSQGLTRKVAAEFSFFLAVPTMLAATAKKLFDYALKDYIKMPGISIEGALTHVSQKFTQDDLMHLLFGNVVAFVVGIFAMKAFVGYLNRNGFSVFGYYRVFLGVILLIIHFFIKPLNLF